MHPAIRHDLLRQQESEIRARVLQAPNGDLARKVGESRIDVRRTFLSEMWTRRHHVRPTPAPFGP